MPILATNRTQYALFTNINVYSKRLKSEHSDLGAFQSCPISKQFGFQTFGLVPYISPNRTNSSVLERPKNYWFGIQKYETNSKLVWDRFFGFQTFGTNQTFGLVLNIRKPNHLSKVLRPKCLKSERAENQTIFCLLSQTDRSDFGHSLYRH